MSARAALIALTAVVALSLAPESSRAQSQAQSLALAPRAAASPREDVAPVVVVRGAPRTFQVAAVPVPAELPRDAAVSWEIAPTGIATVLGALRGTIPPAAPGDSARRLLLTLGVPAHAPAGRAFAAHVRFAVDGASNRADERRRTSIEVDLELDVTAVRRVVVAARALRGARAGSSIDLPLTVTNLGNATDTLDLQLVAPAGWRVATASQRVTLVAGAAADRVVSLSVPRGAGVGSYVVQARVRGTSGAAAADIAAVQALVEVVGARDDAATSGQPGPVLTTGVATSAGTGGGATAAGVTLGGSLTDDVQVSAHATLANRENAIGTQALSRVGYYVAAPYLSLWSPTWQLSAGATGMTLSELAGVNAFGRGASGSYASERWRTAAIGALAEGGDRDERGVIAGAQGAARVGPAWLTGTLSHLEDGFGSDRRLDAAAAGLTLPTAWGTRAEAEVAHRRFDGGSGMGWAGTLVREGPGESIRLRAVHAPGGSAAFARAVSELSASGARAFHGGRALLNGAAWRTRDANDSFGRLETRGWALTPQYAVGGGATVGLDARGSTFEARGDAGAIGSDERSLGASVNVYRDGRYLTGYGAAGRVERSLVVPDGARFVTAAPRTRLRGAVGTTGGAGLAEISASLEQNGRGAGLLPRQAVIGGRIERVPVSDAVTVHAGAFRYDWFGDRDPASLLRAGATIALPAGLALTADAERNPFFVDRRSGGWTVAMKLERAMRLPRAGRRGASGLVYRDANANGVRDEGEVGFEGAVVRRGAQTAVTDARGRYRMESSGSGAPRLDPRSLPYGWLEGESSVPAGETSVTMRRSVPMRSRLVRGAHDRDLNLGVVPTTEAVVTLAVAPRVGDGAAALPSAPISLAAAMVSVSDARGRRWWARVEARGAEWVAVFDALPPGAYVLEVDASQVAEPLRVEGALPSLVVTGAGGRLSARVLLVPRPIRLRRLDAPTPALAPVPQDTVPRLAPRVVRPSTPATPRAAPTATPSVRPSRAARPAPARAARAEPLRTRHVVRPGETLGALAVRYLGDAQRWRLIESLNPGSLPPGIGANDPLRVGIRLWLPAQSAPARRP